MNKMRLDSLVQTFILTSRTLYLVSGLFSTVSGTPFGYGLNTELSEFNNNNVEPWMLPCGDYKSVTEPNVQNSERHGVHRQLKRLQVMIKIAQNHYKKYRKEIRGIYTKVDKTLMGQYELNWLPENQFALYVKNMWCLEKVKKAERILPLLHDGLQRFAITFINLRKFELKSDINVDKRMIMRNNILKTMLSITLRILCEVETTMNNLGLEIPPSHKDVLVTEHGKWSKGGDLTSLLIQESGILELFRMFLNDWKNAFRNATMKGPGTCLTNASRPPILRAKKIKKNNHDVKEYNKCIVRRRKNKKMKKNKLNGNNTETVNTSSNKTELTSTSIRGTTRLCPRKRLTRKKPITTVSPVKA